MTFSRPIFWRQGIFLQPQHFQYSDEFHHSVATNLVKQLRGKLYGVTRCAISADRLASGVLSADEFAAIMPDGTWLELGENAKLPDMDLKNLLTQDGSYRVHVGLIKLTPAGSNIAHDNNPARYEENVQVELASDLYEEMPPLELERLWYRLHFVLESQLDSIKGLTTIPVAQLILEGGVIRLDDAFAPPVLNLDACPALAKKLAQLVDLLAARASQLSTMSNAWREDGESTELLWLRDRLIHAEIAQAVAQLKHRERLLTEPANIFEALLVFVHRLTAMAGISTPDLPSWDHDDPWGGFERLGVVIEALLEQLRSGPDSVAVFKAREGWHEAQIPSASRVGEHRVYLVVQQVSETELLQTAPPKLAALSRIVTIVSRALPGVAIERLQRLPYGLGAGKDSAVWLVDVKDALWQEACDNGTVCLHWLGLPKAARVLFVFFRA
ncbi:MAG: type VI secretion system baseplate subunit TssK [Candidatus Methylopumilus sp.]|nr:type VI secretion system baseplate subunit TssK [Candidatus Methylopumilus sp.]